MGRRRLALTTVLAENAGALAITIVLVLGALFIAAISFIAFLLPQTVGTKVFFAVLLFSLSLPSYTFFVLRSARSLRRRPLRDGALQLTREAAPALYALVDDVARELELPRPASVGVTATFATQLVSNGDRYELLLGLPLMDVVESDELRARVAIEVARAYGPDGLEARAMRAMMRWAEYFLAPHTAADFGFAQVVAAVCLRWFPQELVERRNTRGRDEARRLVDGSSFAGSVLRPAVYDQYVGEMFWSGLLTRHVLNEDAPDAISQLRATARRPLTTDEWARYVNALDFSLDLGDVDAASLHRERWKPASDLLTADVDRMLTSTFDTLWRATVAPHWREASRVARAQEVELAALNERALELSDDAAWRRIELIEARRGATDALPLLRAWLAAHPADGRATFHAGRAALQQLEPDALTLLQDAMVLDERFEAAASQLIGSELARRGDDAGAAQAYERAQEASQRLNVALTGRVKHLDARRMLAHGLASHEIAALSDHFAKIPQIVSVFVSRLEVSDMPSIPCLVVAVRFNWWWSEWHGDEKARVIAGISGIDLPMQIHAVPLDLRRRALGRPPAELIYRGVVTPRSVTLAKWGRRAQRTLIGLGVLLVLLTSVTYRDCFPECWEDISALLVLGPMILGVNALLLTGSPDTPRQRSVAFATSAFFAGMFVFGGAFVLVVPIALAALLRAPLTKGWATWAVAMSVPAFLVGWMVTIV